MEFGVEYPEEIFVPDPATLDEARCDVAWSVALGYGSGVIVVREDSESPWVIYEEEA